MLHFHYVGHFDPVEPIDLARCGRAFPPLKVQRVLPMSAVDCVLESFADIADYIEYDNAGYAICHWSSAPHAKWKSIHEFALALAMSENAVLMNEAPMFVIEYPESARDARNKAWNEKLKEVQE